MAASVLGVTAIEDAAKAGFDLSLLEANLRLTPQQRVERHQAALALAEAMTRAGQELRGRTAEATAAPSRG